MLKANSEKIKRIVPLIVIAILTITFYSYYFHFAINIPFHNDDIYHLTGFLVRYLRTNTFTEKLNEIFVSLSGHKLIFSKTIYLIEYYTFGKINFIWTGFFGNLSIVIYLFIITKSLHLKNYLLYIPVFALYLQPQYAEILFVTSNTISNQWIFLWGILTFYLLNSNNKKYLWIGFLTCLTGTFTHAIGLLLFPISTMIIFIKRKHTKTKILWIISTLVFCTLYFYKSGTSNSDFMAMLTQKPHVLFSNYLYFLGSSLQITRFMFPISLLLGLFSIAWFCYLVFIKYYEKNPIIFSILLWILLAGAMAVMNRSTGNGVDILTFTTSRYKVYCLLNLICIYASAIEVFYGSIKKIFNYFVIAFVSFSLFFNILMYIEWTPIVKRQHEHRITNFPKWLETRSTHFLWVNDNHELANSVLNETLDRELFTPPDL